MMKFVEKLLAVHPYRLTLQFNTGEIRVTDLEPMLRAKGASAQSAYGRLLEPATFCRARLDPESRTVCWDGLAREIATDGTEQPGPTHLKIAEKKVESVPFWHLYFLKMCLDGVGCKRILN